MKKLYLLVSFMACVAIHKSFATETSRASLISPIPVLEEVEISSPGSYKLANNISGQITISNSNVTLDLNNYTISDGNPDGIHVASNVSHVELLNGSIANVSGGSGVNIDTGSDNVTLRRMRINTCNTGVNANLSQQILLRDTVISQCTTNAIALTNCSQNAILDSAFLQSNVGIYLDQTTDTHIYGSAAAGNVTAGIQLQDSHRIVIRETQSLLNGIFSNNDSYGICSIDGTRNLFDQCVVEGTTTLATDASNICAGIFLGSNETDTQILNSTISSTSTPASGDTIAYGIRLSSTYVTPTVKTSNNRETTVNTCAWGPEEPFLVTAGAVTASSTATELHEYNFFKNEINTHDTTSPGATVNSVVWSPSGQYLATCGGVGTDSFDTRVYEVDSTNKILIARSGVARGATVNAISWNPNGRFIATGGVTQISDDEIDLYEFNPDTKTITSLQTLAHSAAVHAVDWSPDGKYLATGGNTSTGVEIRIFELNSGAKTLTLRDSKSHGAPIRSVKWSPSGIFLAVGGDINGGGKDTALYELNDITKTITLLETEAHGATVRSVDWSPDSNYLVTGGDTPGDSKQIRIYTVDRTAKTLTIADSVQHGDTVNAVSWSIVGQVFASAGAVSGGATTRVWEVFQFPSRCVVSQNTSQDTHGSIFELSVGISAPSLSNFIMKNLCYDNDLNYQYTTALYEGGINGDPGNLQNISF